MIFKCKTGPVREVEKTETCFVEGCANILTKEWVECVLCHKMVLYHLCYVHSHLKCICTQKSTNCLEVFLTFPAGWGEMDLIVSCEKSYL